MAALNAVMVADGGGGTVDYGAKLGIQTVFDLRDGLLSVSMSDLKLILYATKINETEVRASIDEALLGVEKELEEMREKKVTIESTLSPSDSAAVYNGESATEARAKIEKAIADAEELQDTLKKLSDEDIESIVEEYNSALDFLKSNAKLAILRDKADEINEAAQSGRGAYYYSDRYRVPFDQTSSMSSREIDRQTYRYVNSCDSYTQVEEYWPATNATRQREPSKRYITRYSGTYTDFKYINYWGTVNSIGKWYDHWPWNAADDDVDDLIARFNAVGIPIPYDEAKVVEYE